MASDERRPDAQAMSTTHLLGAAAAATSDNPAALFGDQLPPSRAWPSTNHVLVTGSGSGSSSVSVATSTRMKVCTQTYDSASLVSNVIVYAFGAFFVAYVCTAVASAGHGVLAALLRLMCYLSVAARCTLLGVSRAIILRDVHGHDHVQYDDVFRTVARHIVRLGLVDTAGERYAHTHRISEPVLVAGLCVIAAAEFLLGIGSLVVGSLFVIAAVLIIHAQWHLIARRCSDDERYAVESIAGQIPTVDKDWVKVAIIATRIITYLIAFGFWPLVLISDESFGTTGPVRSTAARIISYMAFIVALICLSDMASGAIIHSARMRAIAHLDPASSLSDAARLQIPVVSASGSMIQQTEAEPRMVFTALETKVISDGLGSSVLFHIAGVCAFVLSIFVSSFCPRGPGAPTTESVCSILAFLSASLISISVPECGFGRHSLTLHRHASLAAASCASLAARARRVLMDVDDEAIDIK